MLSWFKIGWENPPSSAPKPRRLRTRLLWLGFRIILSVMLLLGGIIFSIAYQTDVTAWQGQQGGATRIAVLTISAFLKRAEDSLSLINLLDPDTLVNQPEIGQKLFLQNQSLLEVIRLDANGQVLANFFQGQEPVLGNLFTIPQSRWFVQAKAGKSYYSRVQVSAADRPYILFALPAPQGGVVAARLSMDVLRSVVDDISFGQTGRTFIVSSNGDLIAHSRSQQELENINLSDNPVFKEVLRSPDNVWHGEYTNLEGLQVTGTSMQVPGKNWIVFTEVLKEESYASSRSSLIILLSGILVLSVFAMLAASRFLESLVLRPISRLREGAEQIGEGNLGYRISMVGGEEIGIVAAAFDRMAQQLSERVQEVAQRSSELMSEVEERKKAEKELLLAHEELEMRVETRTKDLHIANARLLENSQKIEASLREKEVMLKEIHHRVKNNLQVVSSLLNLQSQTLQDPGAKTALRDSQMRVGSMALVHEKLYQSENLDSIPMEPYILSLCETLFPTYRQGIGKVTLVTQVDEVFVGIDDAVPIGLILNELISNSLKHAFPGDQAGEIGIHFIKETSQKALLRYYDTGKGFPDGLDLKKSKSLGMRLVYNLARQLNTEIEFNNHPGVEFKFRVQICADNADDAPHGQEAEFNKAGNVDQG